MKTNNSELKNKKNLIKTAQQLFEKSGYNITTVTQITNEAGVSRATYYYYFKTKDQILSAVIRKNIGEIKDLTGKVSNTSWTLFTFSKLLSQLC